MHQSLAMFAFMFVLPMTIIIDAISLNKQKQRKYILILATYLWEMTREVNSAEEPAAT